MDEHAFEQLCVHGWCMLDGIIPPEDVDRVRGNIDRCVAEHNRTSTSEGHGPLTSLLNSDQTIAPYLNHPRVMAVLQQRLGPVLKISFAAAVYEYQGGFKRRWHSDWPFNQKNKVRVQAPYPDTCMHLSTLWALTDWSGEADGPFVVPGSHRASNNPTGENVFDAAQQHPCEIQVTAKAGGVLIFDSRLWHTPPPNVSGTPRPLKIAVRYAPWWLNISTLIVGKADRRQLLDGKRDGARDAERSMMPMPAAVYDKLPESVRPLFTHMVEHGA